MPLERVAFHYGDSQLPDSPVMAGGSNQTASIFAAVQSATEKAHRELLKLAQRPGVFYRPDKTLIFHISGSTIHSETATFRTGVRELAASGQLRNGKRYAVYRGRFAGNN